MLSSRLHTTTLDCPLHSRRLLHRDSSYHCNVICKLLNDGVFVGGVTIMSEDGAEDGRETREVDSPCL